MDPALESRLRRVYASGNIDDRDCSRLPGADWGESLREVMAVAADPLGIRAEISMLFDSDPEFRLVFTEADGPKFWEGWCGFRRHTANVDKLRWIAWLRRPFPVLWLPVSRVWPCFFHDYNLWKPRGDTGYLDIESESAPPTPQWARAQAAIEAALSAQGIHRLDRETLAERVPFIQEEMFEDEHGNDLPDDGPRVFRTVPVGQALFGP